MKQNIRIKYPKAVSSPTLKPGMLVVSDDGQTIIIIVELMGDTSFKGFICKDNDCRIGTIVKVYRSYDYKPFVGKIEIEQTWDDHDTADYLED